MMKISKLRKKIKNPKWVQRKYSYFAQQHKYWEDFYRFQCSNFFEGEYNAEKNKLTYNKHAPQVERHCEFLLNILKSTNK